MISLAMVLQVIFITATVVRYKQFITLAIGVPKSQGYQGCPNSDISVVSISAAGDIFITFDRKKELQAVAPNPCSWYNECTIKVKDHDELRRSVQRLKDSFPTTRIVIAANKDLAFYVIKQSFLTLNSVYESRRFDLLLRW